jgi:hypothetical protein
MGTAGLSSLDSFNIVLTGDGFPAGSVDTSALTFGSASLQQSSLVPPGVAVVAEGPRVSLHAFPNRIQAAVDRVENGPEDAANLVTLVHQLFDFIGPRTVKSVGHNAARVFHDTGRGKLALLSPLLDLAGCEAALAQKPTSADLHLYFSVRSGALGRVGLLSGDDGVLALDFNAHHELGSSLRAQDAVDGLHDSLIQFAQIVESIAKVLKV